MIDMRVMTVKTKSAEHEKKTAPRPFRKGKPQQFYADDEFMSLVEEWRADQRPVPTKSEALRRLTALALEAEAKKKGGKR